MQLVLGSATESPTIVTSFGSSLALIRRRVSTGSSRTRVRIIIKRDDDSVYAACSGCVWTARIYRAHFVVRPRLGVASSFAYRLGCCAQNAAASSSLGKEKKKQDKNAPFTTRYASTSGSSAKKGTDLSATCFFRDDKRRPV